MTPKIMLDRLRSDWVVRRSSERVIATNQNTEEEDKAQQASGSCDALTAALYDLDHLPDRETPTLGTFEILEQLIVSRFDEAEEKELNLTPVDQGFRLMGVIGEIEAFRLILQDIRSKQAALKARYEDKTPTIPNHVLGQTEMAIRTTYDRMVLKRKELQKKLNALDTAIANGPHFSPAWTMPFFSTFTEGVASDMAGLATDISELRTLQRLYFQMGGLVPDQDNSKNQM